jgi:hypothetical protein
VLLSPIGEPVPRVMTSAMARELGFSAATVRTELRRGRWQLLVRGVYLTRVDAQARADWIAAGMAIAGRGAALSGWDAVRGYGIGSDRPPVDEVLILSTTGTHRVVGQARLRASTRPLDAQRVGRWWSAPAARAVADTALVYRRFDPVRALVTSAVQRMLCTPADLERELEAGPQNGSAHLRRAIEDVFGGAESISEATLADLLDAAGLPEPEFNIPILTWDGRKVANADALWRTLRAGLEVNSKRHHFYEDKWTSTMRRHNRLTITGLSLTHYPPRDLLDSPVVVAHEIEQWLRLRACELGASYPPPPPPRHPDGRPVLHTPYVLPRPL